MRRSEHKLLPSAIFLKSSHDCTLTQLVGNQKLASSLSPETVPDDPALVGDRDHGADAALGNSFQTAISKSFSLRFAFSMMRCEAVTSIPAWLAEANHGFGDASFRFYPPALYYLLALTRTLAGKLVRRPPSSLQARWSVLGAVAFISGPEMDQLAGSTVGPEINADSAQDRQRR